MNTETFTNRIKAIALTQKGSLNKRYCSAMEDIQVMKNGNKIHPQQWVKSKGVYSLYQGNRDRIIDLLTAAKIDYIYGNDAERGGRQGDFFKLSPKGMRQMRNVNVQELIQSAIN